MIKTIKLEKEDLKNLVSNIIQETLFDRFDRLINEQICLYEGLIKSYPVGATVKKIKTDIPDSIIKIDKSNDTNKIIVYLNESGYEGSIDLLKNILQVYGWKITYPKVNGSLVYEEINNILYVKFLIDAIFDINDSESIYNGNGNKKPTKLYHITPLVNIHKIMRNGLSPKTNSKIEYHPERIYFLKNISDDNQIKNFISKLFITNKNSVEYKDKYIILEIDLNNVNQDLKIQFYKDPNMKDAVFTMENINPNMIKLLKIAEVTFLDSDKIYFNVDIKNINESLKNEIDNIIIENKRKIFK